MIKKGLKVEILTGKDKKKQGEILKKLLQTGKYRENNVRQEHRIFISG